MVMRTPTPAIWLQGRRDEWDISVQALENRLSADDPGASTLLLDARPEDDWSAGTIPGAKSLSVAAVTVEGARNAPAVKALIGEVLSAPDTTALVFFANTGAPASDGIQRGRDWWVMTAMLELGLPPSRMLRLQGGLNSWKAAGHPVVPKGALPGNHQFTDLRTFLEHLGLPNLHAPLEATFPEGLSELSATWSARGRVAFLKLLQTAGVSSLKDRQALACGLARALREQALLDVPRPG